jgi:hypothetical protein
MRETTVARTREAGGNPMNKPGDREARPPGRVPRERNR